MALPASGHFPIVSLPDDKFHDHCGVFAVYGHPEAAKLTYLGLYALQHRGQESAGIVTSDGQKLFSRKGMGHVAEVFTNTPGVLVPLEETIKSFDGICKGEYRYRPGRVRRSDAAV